MTVEREQMEFDVVVVGAGGAGRALAFGAAAKGAQVVIANRSLGRAQELAAQVGD